MTSSPSRDSGEHPLTEVLANERVLSGGASAELDEDLKLAMILQEQERAFMALAGGGWGAVPENLPPAGARASPASPAAAARQGSGGDDAGPPEAHNRRRGGGAAEAPGLEELTDEELAARLQAEEQAEFQARLLALAGVGPAGGLAEGADEEGYPPDDPVDPDQMSYEQLTALGEAVGTVARGLAPEAEAALPRARYAQLRAWGASTGGCGGAGQGSAGGAAPGSRQDGLAAEAGGAVWAGEEEQCPVCRLELEGDDELTVLPCGHYYHPDCVGEWLRRNKVCCVCNKEVTVNAAQQAVAAADGGPGSRMPLCECDSYRQEGEKK